MHSHVSCCYANLMQQLLRTVVSCLSCCWNSSSECVRSLSGLRINYTVYGRDVSASVLAIIT